MASYPTINSGTATLTRKSMLPVRVLRFSGGSEQRFRAGKQLETFTISHSLINKTDALAIQAFFNGRKGAYDVFDFTFGGTTYSNLYFATSELTITEQEMGRYSVSLTFAQSK
jgi:phage-related protein